VVGVSCLVLAYVLPHISSFSVIDPADVGIRIVSRSSNGIGSVRVRHMSLASTSSSLS
jgi:hypothetical protein